MNAPYFDDFFFIKRSKIKNIFKKKTREAEQIKNKKNK